MYLQNYNKVVIEQFNIKIWENEIMEFIKWLWNLKHQFAFFI